jgi:hypothetical protein
MGSHDATAVEFWIAVFLLIGWVVAILLLTWHEMRRACSLSRAADPENLQPGPVVLSGVVELARGGTASPIEVSYHEHQHEVSGEDGEYLKWKAAGSTCEARPFYLRLDGERRIRVEPVGASIELAAPLSDPVSTGADTRDRTARIQKGQRIGIAGELRSGEDEEAPAAFAGAPYREMQNATALVIHPFRGQLAITTGEVLPSQSGFRFVHLWWLIGALLISLFLFAEPHTYNAPYEQKGEARIHHVEVQATRNKDGGQAYTCRVFALIDLSLSNNAIYTDAPIDCATARTLRVGATMAWPPYSTSQPSDEEIRAAQPRAAFLLLGLFIALQLVSWRSFRPWHRTKAPR